METNFFKSILSLHVAGNWKINIAKEYMDKLIVSVLFFNGTFILTKELKSSIFAPF